MHAKKIKAFSQLYISGTGGNAQSAALGIMPVVGALKTQSNIYASYFDPEKAIAIPGYYSVDLEDYRVKAELASTVRNAFYRFTFPESDSSHILIDVSHGFNPYRGGSIEIIDDRTLAGTGTYNGYHGSDFDVESAYRAMYKNASEKNEGVPWGRRGLYKYIKYALAPEDAGYMRSKVSDTLEYGPGGSKARNHYPEISGSASATLVNP